MTVKVMFLIHKSCRLKSRVTELVTVVSVRLVGGQAVHLWTVTTKFPNFHRISKPKCVLQAIVSNLLSFISHIVSVHLLLVYTKTELQLN